MITMHRGTAVFPAALVLLMVGCSPALLDEINTAGQADFAAACINVFRQVDAKRITLFAVVPVDPSIKEISGYRIEVVSNPEIIKKHRKFMGAYYNHHNGLVLNFAAVQVLEGDRDLGLYLIRTLARIDPDYEWSSPSLGNRSIQRILQGVEANGGSMQDFLRDEKLQWEWRAKEYGMPKKPGGIMPLKSSHETPSTNNRKPPTPAVHHAVHADNKSPPSDQRERAARPLNGQDSVTLHVAERASYNAEVWGSVGYQVECVVSDEKVVRLLNTRIEYLRSDRPIPPGGDKARKLFTFEAVSKGQAAITFRELFRGELKKTKEIRVAVLD